jgi:tetratricopeptide (TPR) repeat protein
MSKVPAGWNEHSAYMVSERAYLLHTEGRFRESLALFEGLLEIYPDNLYYRDAVSALHLSLGNPEEAIRHASSVIAAAPSYTNGFVRRCEGYLMLGMSEEAKRDLERLKDLRAYGPARRMEMRLMTVRKIKMERTSQRINKLETNIANTQRNFTAVKSDN